MPSILELKQILHLGLIDQENFAAFDAQRKSYFKKYHERFWNKDDENISGRFRGEADNEWVAPRAIEGNDIKELQRFLKRRGFMPGARIDGVFGYWTLASLRLFQHYIRTVEGKKEIGIPDGRVGANTHMHMMRWDEEDLYCAWGPDERDDDNNTFAWTKTSPEYDLWMEALPKIRDMYLEQLQAVEGVPENISLFQLHELNNYDAPTDSRKVADWSFDPQDIHLIGLRCNQEISDDQRGTDDIFILLMNGMVFKFWGSTDPKPASSWDNEPYLLEGQHKYKLSWHNVGATKRAKVYKALVPYQKGVLVFRDWSKNNSLSEEDIRKGLKFDNGDNKLSNPNFSINIHWSANGTSNWSAGCQVISGLSYINHLGKLVDCSEYAAEKYKWLSEVSQPAVKFNRGAYTFVSDFIFAYSSKDYILYTLGRDEHLEKLADPALLQTLNNQDLLHQLQADSESGFAWVQQLVSGMKNSRKKADVV
jgi:hypothetical protein